MQRWAILFVILVGITTTLVQASENAPSHKLHQMWDAQLKRYVSYSVDNGKSSAVDYRQWKQDKDILTDYVESLAAVTPDEYGAWSLSRQLAFLINAYNAHTVLLVLNHYPKINSIKEIGGAFTSPWSLHVGQLLGQRRTLDDIEHGMIRGTLEALNEEGFHGFDDPRIHFAVNCASRGCPPLRNEAYTADTLNAQLNEQAILFLSNEKRNDYRHQRLYVSPIFKWYKQDFSQGWQGATSLQAFFMHYAHALNVDETGRNQLHDGTLPVEYNEYDWALNDTAN